MIVEQIVDKIIDKWGEEAVYIESNSVICKIKQDSLIEICQWLRDNEDFYFDFLSCITAIDNGEQTNTLDIIYNLQSIIYQYNLIFKVVVNRTNPTIPTVSHIWKTANWHEREIFDFFGVNFLNHPDLRRILLPQDWEGYPLRKDYQPQKSYHGIQVKY